MTYDEAFRWCQEHQFSFEKFKYPDNVKTSIKEGVNVYGWAWPKDPAKQKVRISVVAPTLEEAVEVAEKDRLTVEVD